MAAYGAGNFYGFPGPRVTLEPPARTLQGEGRDRANSAGPVGLRACAGRSTKSATGAARTPSGLTRG